MLSFLKLGMTIKRSSRLLCFCVFSLLGNTSADAAQSKCEVTVDQYSKADLLKLKREIAKALRSYDRDSLLELARPLGTNLSPINHVIQQELARYSSEILAKGIQPKTVMVGAGASTAALSATLRAKLSEADRKKMLILESGDVALNTFYDKDFTLNSPTLDSSKDANFIPHGIVQHSDLFTGRPPHSNETAFVFLTNLWFSKIPVAFNSELVKVSSLNAGLAIQIEQRANGKKTTRNYSGIQHLGMGVGPGQQSLRHIARGKDEKALREAMTEAKGDEPLAQTGLYSTLSFLSAARMSKNSKTKIPHEVVIVGHAHSAFTVAEALLRLWKNSPERFKQKPKVLIIGASLENSKEFLEVVADSSQSHSKREIFIDRYKTLLPEFFDDKSVQGIDGRVSELAKDSNGFSLKISPRSRGNSRNLKAPLVVLATGNEEIWQDMLDNNKLWQELDAWGPTLTPKQVQSGRIQTPKNTASSRLPECCKSVGTLEKFGLMDWPIR